MFNDDLSTEDYLRMDQLANLGANFKVKPAFIGRPYGLDEWAWELGQREAAWCAAHSNDKRNTWNLLK